MDRWRLVLVLLVALALFVAFGLNLLQGPITPGRQRGDRARAGHRRRAARRLELGASALPRREGELRQRGLGARTTISSRADAVEAEVSLLPLLRGARGDAGSAPRGRRSQPRAGRRGPQELDPRPRRGRAEEGVAPAHRAAEPRPGPSQLCRRDARHRRPGRPEYRRRPAWSSPPTGTYQGMPLRGSGTRGPVLSLRDESSAVTR